MDDSEIISPLQDGTPLQWREAQIDPYPAMRDTQWYATLIQDAAERSLRKDLDDLFSSGRKSDSFLWITVRPKECLTENFVKRIDKLLSKKWIATAAYTYVIEQAQGAAYYAGMRKNYKDNGKHLHMILHTNKKKSHALREIQNTFKDMASAQCVDVKKMQNKFLSDKMEYILGRKTGDGKDISQAGDIIYRQLKNLQPFYENKI